MNVLEEIRQIYDGPFTQYLTCSKQKSEMVSRQSELVDGLFKLQIDTIEILNKYKKPIHLREEKIIFEPILKQIECIKLMSIENDSDRELRLISNSIHVFSWVYALDIPEFIQECEANNELIFKNEVPPSETDDQLWLTSWKHTIKQFTQLILNNFKEGIVWSGTDKLPERFELGDDAEKFKNPEHLALVKEINQGEDIIKMLKQANENHDD